MAKLKSALKTTVRNSNPYAGTFFELFDFYVRGELTDTVVKVKGCEIKLHKIVLASKSPVFRAMLQSDMQEGRTSFIKIDDVEPEVFREVVHYLYCGFSLELRRHHLAMFECADKYGLTELVEVCENVVETGLNVMNALEYLAIADMHCRENLKIRILDYIKPRVRDVMRTDDWPYVDFRLRTELALRYATTNCSSYLMLPHIDDSTIEIESENTVIWRVDWDSFTSYEPITSPRFQVNIKGELVSFCFTFCRYKYAYYPLHIVRLSHSETALSLSGEFVLYGRNKNISLKKVLNWTQADVDVPYYAVPERKTVLIISDTYINQALLLSNRIKFSFTIAQDSTNRLKKHQPEPILPVKQYFNSPKFSDVKFMVEGQIFYGHRVILASVCTHFDRIFELAGDDCYLLTRVSAKDFDIVLRYLYTNKLPDLVDEKVLDAARICGLDALFSHCERVLTRQVTLQMAVRTLVFSHKIKAFLLKERAKRFIKHNLKEATSHASWALLADHPDLMNELLFDLAGVCPLLMTDLGEDLPLLLL